MATIQDSLTAVGAERLASDIRSYWHGRGFRNVKTRTYLIEGSENAWGTASNLVGGLPPGATSRTLLAGRA